MATLSNTDTVLKVFALLLLMSAAPLFGQKWDSDSLLWLKTSVHTELDEERGFRLDHMLRTHQDSSELERLMSQFIWTHKLKDSLKVDIGTRVTMRQSRNANWAPALRIFAGVRHKFKFDAINVKTRLRVQQDISPGQMGLEVGHVTRGELGLSRRILKRTIPFITTELLVNLGPDPRFSLRDWRLTLGSSIELSDVLALKPFYRYRHNFSGSTRHNHIFGFGLTCQL